MTFKNYLKLRPVLTLLARGDDQEGFSRAVDRVYQSDHIVGGRDIAWYAFEEIGWPEGMVYCRVTERGHDWQRARMWEDLRGREDGIDNRLNIRRKSLKKLVWSYILAHKMLALELGLKGWEVTADE